MLEDNGKKTDRTHRPRSLFSKRWLIIILVIGLIGTGMVVYWVKAENERPRATKPMPGPAGRAIPVVAATVKEGEMKVYLNGLGSVTPLNTVMVKSRVDGQLMEVLFKEGQLVTSGQLLARIDPRPFEVQLTQAEGQMARDQAILKNAQNDLERYKVLWQQNLIQKQLLDTQESLVRQYEGSIKTDRKSVV
jgi:membrane fusion protein, multidrug efflux system